MEGFENLGLDKDFQKSLMDVADMIRRVKAANGCENRRICIFVNQGGASVDGFNPATNEHDFYYTRLKNGGWDDETESMNTEKMKQMRMSTLKSSVLPEEDDLK